MPDQRNVLIESARISRGAVEKLSDLKATSDIDAVVFPGGFGAAKNLSDFAFKGTDMTVDPEVERVLKEFNKSGKPIALCCIAPILAAKVLGSQVYILPITSIQLRTARQNHYGSIMLIATDISLLSRE